MTEYTEITKKSRGKREGRGGSRNAKTKWPEKTQLYLWVASAIDLKHGLRHNFRS